MRHIDGGLWAEGRQDGEDIFYCLAFSTFWILNLLHRLHIQEIKFTQSPLNIWYLVSRRLWTIKHVYFFTYLFK